MKQENFDKAYRLIKTINDLKSEHDYIDETLEKITSYGCRHGNMCIEIQIASEGSNNYFKRAAIYLEKGFPDYLWKSLITCIERQKKEIDSKIKKLYKELKKM